MVFLFSGSAFSGYLYYLIPFIFTFALVFGVLTISKVFKDQKNVNAILALAIALFAVIYPPYITLLYEWLPYLCIIFIVIFVVLMLKNLFVGEKGKKELEPTWPMLIAIAVLFLVFMTVYQSIPLPSGSFISSQDILLIVGIAFVVLILSVGAKLKDKGFEKEKNPNEG